MSKHKPQAERQADIINAAIDCALHEGTGVRRIKREDVAARAGVSPALVNVHFSTMDQLRRATYRAAVKREVLPLIAQGIAERHPACVNAPESLRARALKSLI